MIALMSRRLKFAAFLVATRPKSSRSCLYCGSVHTRTVHRQLALIEVRRCMQCGLMFRFPQPSVAMSHRYYQEDYKDFETGPVTTISLLADVAALRSTNFNGSPWDRSHHISLLRSYVITHRRLLDFGTSWGYFLPQAIAAGFDSIGYEVAKQRAEAGRQLFGVDIVDDEADLRRLDGTIDIIYTGHALEHLTSIRATLQLLLLLLRSGGLLFAFDCGGAAARRLGTRWGPFTNEAHVLSLDAPFLNAALRDMGSASVRFASTPYDRDATEYRSTSPLATTLDGDELLVIAEKP